MKSKRDWSAMAIVFGLAFALVVVLVRLLVPGAFTCLDLESMFSCWTGRAVVAALAVAVVGVVVKVIE